MAANEGYVAIVPLPEVAIAYNAYIVSQHAQSFGECPVYIAVFSNEQNLHDFLGFFLDITVLSILIPALLFASKRNILYL